MNQKVLIIAEAGVNHNGDLKKAIELVKVAAESGADFVKFQTFKTELNISRKAEKATYQKENTGNSESQYDMVKKLELNFEDFICINDKCKEYKIKFLSTGFDTPSIDFLDSFNPEYYKIPSGEITNYVYLRNIAKKNKPIFLSTGMSTLGEIEKALEILIKFGAKRNEITVLHCNTEYPTPMIDVNLKAMLTIGQSFGVKVGYSDHTLGIEVPIAAVALGAIVIEKHFTLNKDLSGPDHKASLEPRELKAMVSSIRNIEKAISGNGRKEPSISESKNISIARKSIHLKNELKAGCEITEGDLIALRPGDGISAIHLNEVIGKKLRNNKNEFDKLTWSDLV